MTLCYYAVIVTKTRKSVMWYNDLKQVQHTIIFDYGEKNNKRDYYYNLSQSLLNTRNGSLLLK